jgi:DNA-binding MarR family transcriptional regulator
LTIKISSSNLIIKPLDKQDNFCMEISPAVSAEQIARELLMIIPRLNRIIARDLRMEFGDDTTIVRMRVLGELAEAPITLSTLAKKREVSLQAASEHIQDLVARGWVLRTPDPNDRRQSLLSLTDDGLRQLEQVREHISRQFTPFIDQFSADEAADMHRGLLALRRVMFDADANDANEQPDLMKQE